MKGEKVHQMSIWHLATWNIKLHNQIKCSICRSQLSWPHPSWRMVWIWTISKTNELYPALLWYFRYPKQERSKSFNQDFFFNRDFKIPHFFLLFLLHSDIWAKSFLWNFYKIPCDFWMDILRLMKLPEIIIDICGHMLLKKFLESIAPFHH